MRIDFRSFVSRAASALAFCAAMAAVALFPDARGVGLSPAQIPPELVDTDPAYQSDNPRFQTPELCQNLGGQLQNIPGGQICAGMDKADSFCIVGSAEAFPCRGLYKHVIECNAKHNRPAQDMFFCAPRCDNATQIARGAKCERIFHPSQAAPSPLSTIVVAAGHSGAAGGLQVNDGHTLDFSASPPPAGVSLTAAPPNDFAYYLTAPLTAELDVSLTAAVECDECYPASLTPVTVGALFSPVFAPPQEVLRADEGAAGELTLRLPADFAENATLRIAEVSPPAAAFTLVGATLSRPEKAPVAGTYGIAVEMTHPEFIGVLTLMVTAEITVEIVGTCDPAQPTVRGENCGRIVPPSRAAPLRVFTIAAAAGYSGPAGELAVNTGHTLDFFASPPPAGFSLAAAPDDNDFTYHLTAPLNAPLEIALTASILCHGCYPDPLTVSAQFSPVFAPPQATLRAAENFAGELTLRAPDGFAENADLRIVDVSPQADGFVLNGATLSRPANAPATGNYTVFVEMTHPGFIGVLTLLAEAEIAPPVFVRRAVRFASADPAGGQVAAAAGENNLQSGDEVNDGTTVTFTASPAAGYYVFEWRTQSPGFSACPFGTLQVSPVRCEVEIIGGDADLTVFFARPSRVVFGFEAPPGAPSDFAVRAAVAGEEIQSGEFTTVDALVVFRARTPAGYFIQEWKGAGAGECPAGRENARGPAEHFCQRTAGEDGLTATVVFARLPARIEFGSAVSLQPGASSYGIPPGEVIFASIVGVGAVASGHETAPGGQVVFGADVQLGYHIARWTGLDACPSGQSATSGPAAYYCQPAALQGELTVSVHIAPSPRATIRYGFSAADLPPDGSFSGDLAAWLPGAAAQTGTPQKPGVDGVPATAFVDGPVAFRAAVPAGYFIQSWSGIDGCPSGRADSHGPADYQCDAVAANGMAVNVVFAVADVAALRIDDAQAGAHCESAGGTLANVLYAPQNLPVGRACIFGQDAANRQSCFAPDKDFYNPALHAAQLEDDAAGMTGWAAMLCDYFPEHAECDEGENQYDTDNNPLTPCIGRHRINFSPETTDGTGHIPNVFLNEAYAGAAVRNDDTVFGGSTLVFVAWPGAGYNLSEWRSSAPELFSHCQREEDNVPEVQCRIIVGDADINVTAVFARRPIVSFAGQRIRAPGARITVPAAGVGDVEMTYRGLRRGLHLLFGERLLGELAVEELCQSGGADFASGREWRLPTFAEAVGAMAANQARNATLGELDAEDAGAAVGMRVEWRLWDAGDAAALDEVILTGLFAHIYGKPAQSDDYQLLAARFADGENLQMAATGDTLRPLCVLAAADDYGEPNRLARANMNIAGTPAPVSRPGDAMTIAMNITRRERFGLAGLAAVPLAFTVQRSDPRLEIRAEQVPHPLSGETGPGALHAAVRLNAFASAHQTLSITVAAWPPVGITARMTAAVVLEPVARFAVNFEQAQNGTLSAAANGSPLQSGGNVPAEVLVTFTAGPDAGYFVSGWGGDCETDGEILDRMRLGQSAECVVAAGENISVSAAFSLPGSEREVRYAFSAPQLPTGAAAPSSPTVRALLREAQIPSGGEAVIGDQIVFQADIPAGYFIQSWTGAPQCPDGQTAARGPTVLACPPVEVMADLTVSAAFAALPFESARINAATLETHCVAADGRRVEVRHAPPGLPPSAVGFACVFDREPARGCFAPSQTAYNPHIHAAGPFADDDQSAINWGERLCDNAETAAECEPDANISHDHDGNPLTPCAGPMRRIQFAAENGSIGVLRADGTRVGNGDQVFEGTPLRFRAAAGEDGVYLSRWRSDSALFSHCPAGIDQSPQSGEVIECEVRANADIGVTVVFQRPGLFTFGDKTFTAPGERATLSFGLISDLPMIYHGNRRGLRLVHSIRTLSPGDAEETCRRGGTDDISGRAWRLPSFPEALGALADAESESRLGEIAIGASVEGVENGMQIPLRPLAEDDAANLNDPNGFFAHLYGEFAGTHQLTRVELRVNSQDAVLTPGAMSRVLCVVEIADDYGPPNRLARVVLDPAPVLEAVADAADAFVLTMRLARRERAAAAPAVAETLFFTVRADPRISLRAERIPLPQSGETGPGRLRAVLRLTDPPQTFENLAATVEAWPVFGLTARITATIRLAPESRRVQFQSRQENGGLRVFGAFGEIQNGFQLPGGSRATFTAAPDNGYYVAEWTGDCAAAGQVGTPESDNRPKNCVLQVDDDLQAAVRFEPTAWRLNFSAPKFGVLSAADENGQPLQNGAPLTPNATVAFTATPGAGLYVSGWQGCDEFGSIGGPTDTAAKTCRAVATVPLSVEVILTPLPVADANAALIAASESVPLDAGRARLMIELGADPNVALSDGRTPLLAAAQALETELVRELIVAGANPNATFPGTPNRNISHWAAHEAHLPMRLEVLQAFAEALPQSTLSFSWSANADPSYRTPLSAIAVLHQSRLGTRVIIMAGLIYEQGGRCTPFYAAQNLTICRPPFYRINHVFQNAAAGEVDALTLFARDLGRATFNLQLPAQSVRNELLVNGWTLRPELFKRPAQIILARTAPHPNVPASFAITGVHVADNTPAFSYQISVRPIFVQRPEVNRMFDEESRRNPPDLARLRELINLGADPNAIIDGQRPLIRAAEQGRAAAVSILILAGAHPEARHAGPWRAVPHLLAREPRGPNYVETMRNFIVALDQVGFAYNWNLPGDAGVPLDFIAGWHGGSTDHRVVEMAALLYERGGRCGGGSNRHCQLPVESVNADLPALDRAGDFFTLVARDLGAADFNLPLPSAAALAALAQNGWDIRAKTDFRPQQLILQRRAEVAFPTPSAVTITAFNNAINQPAREYRISFRLPLDRLLQAESRRDPPDIAQMRRLTMMGADPTNGHVDGLPLIIRAAEDGDASALHALMLVGAHPNVRDPRVFRSAPHLLALNPLAPGYVESMKSFITALHENEFIFNWNLSSYAGSPLNIVSNWFGDSTDPRVLEMAALLYERGSRCSQNTRHCRVPISDPSAELLNSDRDNPAITITARDFAGAQFDLFIVGQVVPEDSASFFTPAPGWTGIANFSSRPQHVILRREDGNAAALVLTVIARDANGQPVHEYRIDLRATLNKLLEDEARSETPDIGEMRRLTMLGADPSAQVDGQFPLTRAAFDGMSAAVSALVVVGAHPELRHLPGFRRVPHLMARNPLAPGYVETMKSFIAALNETGFTYNWNIGADAGTPLNFIANWWGNSTDPRVLEMAALLYERGGRCSDHNTMHCQLPVETATDVDFNRTGDIATIVARDFGGAQFDLVYSAEDLSPYLSNGWQIGFTNRVRPRRIIIRRNSIEPGPAFDFTVTAVNTADNTPGRVYRISEVPGLDAALNAEARSESPDLDEMRRLTLAGANPDAVVDGQPILIQAALDRLPAAVSALVAVGADPAARSPGTNRQVPHWVARAPAQPLSAETLRNFIAAVEAAGLDYDWNAAADVGSLRPLDFILAWSAGSRDPQVLDIVALMMARGGQCSPAHRHLDPYLCDSVEARDIALTNPDFLGVALTIAALDLGTVRFDLSFPSASVAADLGQNGWTLRAETAARPHRVILSRASAARAAPAVFTITAFYAGGAEVARTYPVSVGHNLNELLYAAVTVANPDVAYARRLVELGADPDGIINGRPMLLTAALSRFSAAVSVLIHAGANHLAREAGSNRQIPHLMARDPFAPGSLETLQNFIAAVAAAGLDYDWQSGADSGSPLNFIPEWHGDSADPRVAAIAGLIYEHGGRCNSGSSSIHCEVPIENRMTVFSDESFAGDFLTIVARDLGGAQFDLSLPSAAVVAALGQNGWALRMESVRPQRIILSRVNPDIFGRAVFSITAHLDGAPVRIHALSVSPPMDALFVNEALRPVTDIPFLRQLLNDGADPNAALPDQRPLLIAAAQAGLPQAVSVLLLAGADHLARHPRNNRQVPHIAAREASDPAKLNVLRNYIAAAAEAGDAYDWNAHGGADGPAPLDFVARNFAGTSNPTAREAAALIRERGGRCAAENAATAPVLCAVPAENRSPVAFGRADDRLTIIARDFGGVQFNLRLPAESVLSDLRSDGWTLRLESARPQRVLLNRAERLNASEKVFTVTAFAADDSPARIYAVSAAAREISRFVQEVLRPETNVTLLQSMINNISASPNALHPDGTPLLLVAAEEGRALAVSVLIVAGANHEARHPAGARQIPHIAADNADDPARLNVLRHYIAALEERSLTYNWSALANGASPLDFVAADFPDLGDDAAHEVAALIYERGGRCASVGGAACGVPVETIDAVDAHVTLTLDFTGDLLTVIARDFGGAEFNLNLPAIAPDLAAEGWTLRAETDARPHKIIFGRIGDGTGATAVFFITADSADGRQQARRYAVSLQTDANPEFAAAVLSRNVALMGELLSYGADPDLIVAGAPALLRVGAFNRAAISLLIAAGANPNTGGRPIPYQAARYIGQNGNYIHPLLGFIEGLEAGGHPYDWNVHREFGRPLDWIATHHPHRYASGLVREAHALIYERGGRCGVHAGTTNPDRARICAPPVESRAVEVAAGLTGDALTIAARVFATLRFALQLPSDDVLSDLERDGWSLRAETEAHPHKVILSRPASAGGANPAMFTITAKAPDGAVVRRYAISANTNENAELVALALGDAPDLERMRELIAMGANPDARTGDGIPLLLAAAEGGRAQAVSVLIGGGAAHAARHPTNGRQVPHIAAAASDLPLLRNYIAAIGEEGADYDWSADAGGAGGPLDFVAARHPNLGDATARETAALIYERGGRCLPANVAAAPAACGVPMEAVAPAALVTLGFTGALLTVTARDFGGVTFNLNLPADAVTTALAAEGWTLRAETDARPHKIIFGRMGDGTAATAAFSITANSTDGTPVRVYAVSARANINSDFALAVSSRNLALMATLLSRGADPDLVVNGQPALNHFRYFNRAAVSLLIAAGANPNTGHRPIPYEAARYIGNNANYIHSLLGFIEGLEAGGRSYDWNVHREFGRPLDWIATHHPHRYANGLVREAHALIYERGGRCGVHAGTTHPDRARICAPPVDARSAEVAADFAGDALTIAARLFATLRFSLALPSDDALSALERDGWSLRAETEAHPHRVILNRFSPASAGEESKPAIFTIIAKDPGGADVRVYPVSVGFPAESAEGTGKAEEDGWRPAEDDNGRDAESGGFAVSFPRVAVGGNVKEFPNEKNPPSLRNSHPRAGRGLHPRPERSTPAQFVRRVHPRAGGDKPE